MSSLAFACARRKRAGASHRDAVSLPFDRQRHSSVPDEIYGRRGSREVAARAHESNCLRASASRRVIVDRHSCGLSGQ